MNINVNTANSERVQLITSAPYSRYGLHFCQLSTVFINEMTTMMVCQLVLSVRVGVLDSGGSINSFIMLDSSQKAKRLTDHVG